MSLSDDAERMWVAWLLFLRQLLHLDNGFRMRVPGFVSRAALERALYLEHFPQQVISAVPNSRPHDSTAMAPAACIHLYDGWAGSSVSPPGIQGIVYGPCARFEDGRWDETRLSQFTMLEWVAIGTSDFVGQLEPEVSARVSAAFDRLGLPVDRTEATDPFFAGPRSGAALLQRMSGAKHEWRSPRDVALCSVNRHGDAYGTRFDIRSAEAPAHSVCVAFGIERLVLAGMAEWGEDSDGWPVELSSVGRLP